MAHTAVQLAANREVSEVSEGMSHCTTVSFTLVPTRLLLQIGDLLLGKEPFASSPRTMCKEEPLRVEVTYLANGLFTTAPPS